VQTFRSGRIYLSQTVMYRLITLLGRHPLIFLTHGQVGLIAGEYAALDERVHVQSCTADNDRRHAARQNILRSSVCQFDIPCHRERFAGLAHIEQMVRYALPFLHIRLGGADIHPTVKLHGIRRNDLSMQLLRQRDR